MQYYRVSSHADESLRMVNMITEGVAPLFLRAHAADVTYVSVSIRPSYNSLVCHRIPERLRGKAVNRPLRYFLPILISLSVTVHLSTPHRESDK